MSSSTAQELELPTYTPPAPASTTAPRAPQPDRLRAMWDALPHATRARYADRAEGRLDFIKPYQLETAALTAFKRSAINGSVMGSGKTLMALFHAHAINAWRTAVILPTRLINTWKRECNRVNIPCVLIENATDARRVSRQLWLDRRAGKKPSTITVYLISWEWLSLGGDSNMRFDPWYAFLRVGALSIAARSLISTAADERRIHPAEFLAALTPEIAEELCARAQTETDAAFEEFEKARRIDPKKAGSEPIDYVATLRAMLDLQLARVESEREAKVLGKAAPLPPVDLYTLFDPPKRATGARADEDPGVGVLSDSATVERTAAQLRNAGIDLVKGQSYRYEAHHPVCPKCAAKAPVWHGTHCSCGYEPRGYLGCLTDELGEHREMRVNYREERRKRSFRHEQTSNRSYPGYKILPKFDLKIVEEFHKAVSLKTLHGMAIFDVDATDTLLLSGTLCRSYITELEPALCLVHENLSAEFPYARHDLSDFRSRFSSYSVRLASTEGRNGATRTRILSRTVIPEASNLNALRRLTFQRTVSVSEEIVDQEWQLRPTPEHVEWFSLLPDELESYNEILTSVLSWRQLLYEQLSSTNIEERRAAQTALLRGVRNRLDLVSAITNGPSKVQAAVAWARRVAVGEGHRSIVACRSVALFKALEKAFKSEGFDFAVCDETIDNAERDEFLTEFAASTKRILLTRIKLVAEGFNQLVCCTRQLMCEVERSPSDNRQFQKRMNRPGQTRPNDLRCDLLVARLPNGQASIDEVEIRRFLRKERAIKEVTGRKPRFRGAMALLQATQESRGLVSVLDDLANRVLSDYTPTAFPEPVIAPASDDADAVPVATPLPPQAPESVATPLELPVVEPTPLPVAPKARSKAKPATPPPTGVGILSLQDLWEAATSVAAPEAPRQRRPRVAKEPSKFVQSELGF